jgi:hypothetical protein
MVLGVVIAVIAIDAVFMVLFLKYSHLSYIKRSREGRKPV